MILRDFLKSPNKQRGIPGLSTIKKDLDTRFNKLFNKNKTNFSYKVYKTNKALYIKVKVPSETVKGIFYDTFIELKKVGDTNSIFEFEIKTISNSPSFVFYHAYVYNKNKLIVDNKGLLKALPRESLKKAPEQRNSYEVLLYEKTTYFALKYLFERLHLNTRKIVESAISVKESDMTMLHADVILKKRRLAEKKESDKRRKEKERQKKREAKNGDKFVDQSKTSKKTDKSIHKSKKVNQSKRVKKK